MNAFLFFLATLFLALHQSAWAAPSLQSVLLTESPITVLGEDASARFIVEQTVPGARLKAQLRLDWTASQLVDIDRSTITILVNGRPISSRALTDVRGRSAAGGVFSGSFQVETAPLNAGFHEVKVTARLRIVEDPCLSRSREEAWLTIEAGSKVSWPARAIPDRYGLADFPGVWQRLSADRSMRPIGVVMQAALDPNVALARIEADHMLRYWGLRTQHIDSESDSESPAFHLRLLSESKERSTKRVQWKELEKKLVAANDAVAAVGIHGGSLLLLARDVTGLRDGVALLRSEKVRSLCAYLPCLLGERHADSPPKPSTISSDVEKVWSIRDQGFTQGLQSIGLGVHRFETTWARPPTWTISKAPRLQFNMRWSDSMMLDHELSTFDVAVNSIPLASFRLKRLASERASVSIEIPEYLWGAAEWKIQVTTRLQVKSQDTCKSFSTGGVWLVVEPDSALYVPRREATYGSISQHFKSTSERPALVLPAALTAGEIAATAAILYPFNAVDAQQKWRIAKSDHQGACVQVERAESAVVESPNARRLRLKRVDGAPHWLDASGLLELPLVRAVDSVLISYLSTDKCLHVSIGTVSTPFYLDAPDLSSMHTRQALYSVEKWTLFDADADAKQVRSIGSSPSLEPKNDVLKSEKQVRALWINAAWGALAVTILGVVLFLFWRHRKHDGNEEL